VGLLSKISGAAKRLMGRGQTAPPDKGVPEHVRKQRERAARAPEPHRPRSDLAMRWLIVRASRAVSGLPVAAWNRDALRLKLTRRAPGARRGELVAPKPNSRRRRRDRARAAAVERVRAASAAP